MSNITPEEEPKYIVCVGPPFEEQTFYGPFDDFEDACIWADQTSDPYNWIVTLYPGNDSNNPHL
jgi:hypothetical protein